MRLPTISAGKTKSSKMESCTAVKVRLRGLDLLERTQLGNRDEDDDSFLATNINLLGCGDVQFAQLGLQVGIGFQIHQGTSDGVFKVIGFLTGRFDNLRG